MEGLTQEEMMRNAALESDRHDLIEVLKQRFGEISEEIQRKIMTVADLDVMDHLFVVAVNAANWEVFIRELNQGKHSFKIIGEDFNPLSEVQKNRTNEN